MEGIIKIIYSSKQTDSRLLPKLN